MRHALAVMLLFVVGSANAASVVYSSPGVVTGIGGLDIGGTLYNVDFETGDYSTFGGVEDFWGTIGEAGAAATAINAVLNVEGGSGSCAFSNVCVNKVMGLDELGDTYSVSFGGFAAISTICWTSCTATWTLDFPNSVQVAGFATAWSVVPLPAAVWMFGSALAGLGWMRRRQTA